MTDTNIAYVHARRVWDSRGRPTVEADILLEGGAVGRAIAPAGASTGSGEALDLRDGGMAFGGYGVSRAIANVNTVIAHAVAGLDATDQEAVDDATDRAGWHPRQDFRLGANALLSVSMATAHAAAAATGQPLYRYLGGIDAALVPLPQIQIFGGGAHAGRRVDIQDFMVMCPAAVRPSCPAGVGLVRRRSTAAAEQSMEAAGPLAGVADEGGWWPAFSTNEQALDMLVAAIEEAGFRPGEQVGIALDIAASEFGKGGQYRMALDRTQLTTEGMIDMLVGWIGRYPKLSVEDPLAEDDIDGFVAFSRAVGDKLQIVGDDFLVSDADRLREAAEQKATNTVLLKPNQRGTLTETLDTRRVAAESGFATIVSARSGETEDVTIAHLAVGWGAGQLKVGSFARGERMAKWNEMLRIEEALGGKARFVGGSVLGRSRP